MRTTPEHIENLILSFFSESLSPVEEEELNSWIALSEENRKYFQKQQEIWFSCTDENELKEYDAEKAFRLFKNRINASSRKKDGLSLKLVARYAAAILALCLISYFSYNQGENNLKGVLKQITVEVPLGSQTRLYLPDKTMVVLNAGSRISYSQDFGVYKREVEIEGEGYFEVMHNDKLPFKVKSRDVQVNVLGTKFNIKDYPEDDNVTVFLYKGKVELDNRLKSEVKMLLKPNEYMVMDKKDGVMKKGTAKSELTANWSEGNLIFYNTPMSEVIKSLERSYGISIRIQTDSLKRYHFNGSFNRTEMSITDILETLQATGKMTYAQKGKTITLY